MIIPELLDVFREAENTEKIYDTLAQYKQSEISIANIIDTVGESSLTDDKKQLLYQYLSDRWTERYNEALTNPTIHWHIEEYVHLAMLLEDTDKISFAAELTKNVGKIKKASLCEYWRKLLSEIKDYSKMLHYFCIVDTIADLDDNVMKELFTSYSYSVSDDEWRSLIRSQLDLKHIKLLERLYNVAGSPEHFVELSGMSYDQLTEYLENITDVSDIYSVSAYILAAELHKYFDSDFSFMEQAGRYVECNDTISTNMTAYYTYNEFLRRGCIPERLKTILSGLSPRHETMLHQSVVRLNIRCIDKCLDEELDITGFLECTRSVNSFADDSRLKTISWDEMLDVSTDGFGTEKSAAQARLDILFDQISDKKLLVYIFLNTYLGVFCDMKDFIFKLADSGFDIGELFAEHTLRSAVNDVEPKFRKLIIRILRYNCSNITTHSPVFKGLITRHDIIQIRIIGIGYRKDGERFIRIMIDSLQNEYNEETLILCIEEILKDLPEEIRDVKYRLCRIPVGWLYKYSLISMCLFGFNRTYKLITACKSLVSAAAEKYGAEATINMYMNSFLRTSLPVEFLCEILYKEFNTSAEDIDMWLSEYQFICQRKFFYDLSYAIVAGVILNDKNGLLLPKGTKNCDLINIHVYEKNSDLAFSAIPVEDIEKSDNPKYVHKFTEMKLKGCSENIDFSLGRKFIIDQASDQAFAKEIIADLVKGLYLRITKCGYKNKSAAVDYLKYFNAVNPFATRANSEYRDASADKTYRKWHRVKPFVEEQYSHNEVYRKLLTLGLPYKDICYIYLNSPLKYEISVFDLMRECLEGFITDNTAVPEFRLLGYKNYDGTIRIAEVRSDNGYPAVITNCDISSEYKWFSFSPEYRLDGSIALTDIKKHIQDPYTLKVTSEELTDTFPVKELRKAVTEFFNDPAARQNTDLYSIFNDFSLENNAYIGDCFGEYRIFARLTPVGIDGIIPLNVSNNEGSELRSIGGFAPDKSKIYAMVPVFYSKDKKLLCVPTAKYDESTETEWENCFTENDVPLQPIGFSLGKYPYTCKVPDITKQFIILTEGMSLEKRFNALLECRFRCQLNLSKTAALYDDDEVNNILKGLVVTYSTKLLRSLSYCFGKALFNICLASEDGYQEVHINNAGKTDAVLLLNFMKYEQKNFYFTIEKAYYFDPDIPWHTITSEEDIPDSAVEIEDLYSEEHNIIIPKQIESVTE